MVAGLVACFIAPRPAAGEVLLGLYFITFPPRVKTLFGQFTVFS